MDGKVDLGDGLLLLYRADSIVDLANALVILGHGRLGLRAVGVHFEGRERRYTKRCGTAVGARSYQENRRVSFGEREKWMAGVWQEELGIGPGRGRKMARLPSVGGERRLGEKAERAEGRAAEVGKERSTQVGVSWGCPEMAVR